MCSTDFAYDNSAIIIIGNAYCPNTECLGKFDFTKRLFNLSAEAIINVRNVGLFVRYAIFPLKIKQTPFSCRLVQGFTFLKRVRKQFRILLEMSIVLASIASTERNVNLLVVM